jgi:hypothetical protein
MPARGRKSRLGIWLAVQDTHRGETARQATVHNSPHLTAIPSGGIDWMSDLHSTHWVIWNGFFGLMTLVQLGDIEEQNGRRLAWLEEPFDMVGPFSLTELETQECIAFEECLVMSQKRWFQDQGRLKREGAQKRQQAEARLERRARFDSGQQAGRQHPLPQKRSDRQPREILQLPPEGQLEPTQIKAAFRKLAQRNHPDVGGNTELFQQITEARDQLLAIFV